MRRLWLALLFLAGMAAPLRAAVPNGFVDEFVAGGISAGTAMAFAPDGRLFVCQQSGIVKVVKNGVVLPQPFVSLSVSNAGERGVIGIAFDPAFAANGYVYLHYTTATAPVRNRVSRFTASGDTAVPGSEVVLIEMDPLSTATNHNGGGLAFLADGTMLVAVGENATPSNSQTLANLLGKILRINADGSIPTDNPFYGAATGVNRAIWALGLRNPFTLAVQESTGRVFLNDVGQSAWEEIDDGIAGANYGWPLSEGPTSTPGETGPLYAYAHGTGPLLGCAIAGGAFYEAQATPFPSSYDGDYFFADLCGGWINRRDGTTGAVSTFASGVSQPVDLDVGGDGALYYLARGASQVRRIRYVPALVSALTRTSGTPVATLPVSWSATATGGGQLEYRYWVYDVARQAWTSNGYSAASTFAFTPASAGNYIVQVWARNAGSSEAWEGYASSGVFAVAPAPLSVTGLVPNQQLPFASGVPVTWTATVAGGVGPFEYRYWVSNGTAWSVARDYSASAAWTWTPTATGTYAVRVWVRTVGSPLAFDGARDSGPFTVAAAVPATPTLVPSVPFPVKAGTSVTWTAATTGGRQPTQYRYWVYQQSAGAWRLGRDWGAQPAWTWRPSQADTYIVQVWVRAAGSVAAFDAWRSSGVVTVQPGPVTAFAIVPDRQRPFAPGTAVQWTIAASGGATPLEYRFLGYDGASWSVVREYGPGDTASWVLGAGTRLLQGWVRPVGSSAAYEAWTSTGVIDVAPAPVSLRVQSNQTFPIPANTPITWTALGAGGSAPLEYRFLRYDGSTWTIVRDWSPVAAWSWTPGVADAGAYALQVWARSAGQPSYEAWTSTGFFTVSP